MVLIIMVSQVPTLKKTKMTSYTCHLGLKGMYIENKNQDDEVQFIILVHKVTLTGKKPWQWAQPSLLWFQNLQH